MEKCEKGKTCCFCNKEASWVNKYEIKVDGETYLQEDYFCRWHKASNTRWFNRFVKRYGRKG